MADNFIGKNALITGASSGIGRDIAYIMAEKGINLILLARREDALIKIKEDIQDKFSIKIIVIELLDDFCQEINKYIIKVIYPRHCATLQSLTG